jgi:hypothetical protein
MLLLQVLQLWNKVNIYYMQNPLTTKVFMIIADLYYI